TAARRAGTQLATSATTASKIANNPYVTTSVALTPNRRLDITRVRPNAASSDAHAANTPSRNIENRRRANESASRSYIVTTSKTGRSASSDWNSRVTAATMLRGSDVVLMT